MLNNSKWTGYFNLENTAFEPDNALNQTVDMKKLPEEGFNNGYYENAFTTYGQVPDDNIITLANPLYSLVSQFAVNDPDRNFAVEYDFPLMVKGNIIFEIPSGYEAIIPEEKIVSMKENIFYGQSFKQVEGMVVSNYQFLIGETVFEQKDIASLKRFIDTALEASKELVVLKRKH